MVREEGELEVKEEALSFDKHQEESIVSSMLLRRDPEERGNAREEARKGEVATGEMSLPLNRGSWITRVKWELFCSMLALMIISVVGTIFVVDRALGSGGSGLGKNQIVINLAILGLFLMAALLLFQHVLGSHIEGGLSSLRLALEKALAGEVDPSRVPGEFWGVVDAWRKALASVQREKREKDLINTILAEAASSSSLRGFCRAVSPLLAEYGGLEMVRFVGRRPGGKGWETLCSFPGCEEKGVDEGVGDLTFLFFHQNRVWGGMEVAPRPPSLEWETWLRLSHFLAVAMASVSYRERMDHLSVIDELTGFYNRRHLFVSMQREINRAERYKHFFSVVMMDIDNFKLVNDTYGHAAGDTVLMEVGRLVRNSIRASDQPFRFGGEEFVVLLPSTPLEGAEKVADRLVKRTREMEIDIGGTSIRVTISAGVATYRRGDTPSTLLKKADDALYKAKREGKDRYVTFKEEGESGVSSASA